MTAPTLPEIIRATISQRLQDMHVAMPGRVTAYDRVTQMASVQPQLGRIQYDEAGKKKNVLLPVVHSVPVVFPGAGDYSITFPIAVGDLVLLVFSEQTLDRWILKGADETPLDQRRFTATDAIAIPGLRSKLQARTNLPTDAMVIEAPGEIRIGSVDADDPVVRKSDLQAWINTYYKTHTHPETSTTTGTPTGGSTHNAGACSPTVKLD